MVYFSLRMVYFSLRTVYLNRYFIYQYVHLIFNFLEILKKQFILKILSYHYEIIISNNMSELVEVIIKAGSKFYTAPLKGCIEYTLAEDCRVSMKMGFFADDIKNFSEVRRVFITKADAQNIDLGTPVHSLSTNKFIWTDSVLKLQLNNENNSAKISEFNVTDHLQQLSNVAFLPGTQIQFTTSVKCWFVEDGNLITMIRAAYYPFTIDYNPLLESADSALYSDLKYKLNRLTKDYGQINFELNLGSAFKSALLFSSIIAAPFVIKHLKKITFIEFNLSISRDSLLFFTGIFTGFIVNRLTR